MNSLYRFLVFTFSTAVLLAGMDPPTGSESESQLDNNFGSIGWCYGTEGEWCGGDPGHWEDPLPGTSDYDLHNQSCWPWGWLSAPMTWETSGWLHSFHTPIPNQNCYTQMVTKCGYGAIKLVNVVCWTHCYDAASCQPSGSFLFRHPCSAIIKPEHRGVSYYTKVNVPGATRGTGYYGGGNCGFTLTVCCNSQNPNDTHEIGCYGAQDFYVTGPSC